MNLGVLDNITNIQFGVYMLVFGMGLTLVTLNILTWFMRVLTVVSKEDIPEKG
jgi:Na+-transporting methylmalonyl-CoA/oxaloacetate decarboxylase gamma subunit